jgi:hypothetical protein
MRRRAMDSGENVIVNLCVPKTSSVSCDLH